jgi:hypothetical protein
MVAIQSATVGQSWLQPPLGGACRPLRTDGNPERQLSNHEDANFVTCRINGPANRRVQLAVQASDLATLKTAAEL